METADPGWTGSPTSAPDRVPACNYIGLLGRGTRCSNGPKVQAHHCRFSATRNSHGALVAGVCLPVEPPILRLPIPTAAAPSSCAAPKRIMAQPQTRRLVMLSALIAEGREPLIVAMPPARLAAPTTSRRTDATVSRRTRLPLPTTRRRDELACCRRGELPPTRCPWRLGNSNEAPRPLRRAGRCLLSRNSR